ncbi:hypothetical protein BRX36_19875 [Sphingomonas sp. S-NIH.Pt1_0416]|uniref:hypothetical protein n=1 Tax=Sphingomonas sp. S-NIH.Pt1_0416 TaxID=1920123 RepID=UPI000F7E59BF|nr:hypothetical protein [Sphingomonas sp. S-NIH.Pt1_0416]RSU58926.1 hypothetical protein BRX36_19875 [Sphingomonas sp. S-NIH.Pt1_0416]
MTAMSMIVQPHAAYFITDTAFYLGDGTVVSFGPKVHELNFGPLVGGAPATAAFAMTGIITPQHVTDTLQRLGVTDLKGVWDALPSVIRQFSAALPNAHRAPGVGDDNTILLALAFWDHGTSRPYGYLIGNEHCEPVLKGQMEPFQPIAMKAYVMRRLTGGFDGFDYDDPAQFDPIRDAGALLDDQRDDPFQDTGERFTGVGGQGVLTEISAAGVRYHLLRTWPDKVGERIAVTPRAAEAIREQQAKAATGEA